MANTTGRVEVRVKPLSQDFVADSYFSNPVIQADIPDHLDMENEHKVDVFSEDAIGSRVKLTLRQVPLKALRFISPAVDLGIRYAHVREQDIDCIIITPTHEATGLQQFMLSLLFELETSSDLTTLNQRVALLTQFFIDKHHQSFAGASWTSLAAVALGLRDTEFWIKRLQMMLDPPFDTSATDLWWIYPKHNQTGLDIPNYNSFGVMEDFSARLEFAIARQLASDCDSICSEPLEWLSNHPEVFARVMAWVKRFQSGEIRPDARYDDIWSEGQSIKRP